MKNQILEKMAEQAVVELKTTVKLKGGKKNEHQGRITKITKDLLVKFVTPEQYVQAKQEVEPTFQIKPRPWGQRLDNGLIEHKGQLYVEVQIIESGKTQYFLDNQPIDKSDIIGMNEQYTDSDDIIIRTYKLESFQSIQ